VFVYVSQRQFPQIKIRAFQGISRAIHEGVFATLVYELFCDREEAISRILTKLNRIGWSTSYPGCYSRKIVAIMKCRNCRTSSWWSKKYKQKLTLGRQKTYYLNGHLKKRRHHLCFVNILLKYYILFKHCLISLCRSFKSLKIKNK